MDAACKQILDIFTLLRNEKSLGIFHLQIYFAEAMKNNEFNFFKNKLWEDIYLKSCNPPPNITPAISFQFHIISNEIVIFKSTRPLPRI